MTTDDYAIVDDCFTWTKEFVFSCSSGGFSSVSARIKTAMLIFSLYTWVNARAIVLHRDLENATVLIA